MSFPAPHADFPMWIVAADAAVAKIFASASPKARPAFVERIDHEIGRLHAHELGSDRPGAVVAQAYAPKHDPADVEEERFARALAHRIEHARRAGTFAQLALAMPPKLLGMVRRGLSHETRALVVAELHHRLVDQPADVVAERVHAASPEARLR